MKFRTRKCFLLQPSFRTFQLNSLPHKHTYTHLFSRECFSRKACTLCTVSVQHPHSVYINHLDKVSIYFIVLQQIHTCLCAWGGCELFIFHRSPRQSIKVVQIKVSNHNAYGYSRNTEFSALQVQFKGKIIASITKC